MIMALSERTLALLENLRSLGDKVDEEGNSLIVNTFQQILSNGETYKINEIENWLETNPQILVSARILNVAHYQKAKFDAKNPLKMIQENCSCKGDN